MKKKYLHEYTLKELLLEESEPDFTDTEFMTAVKELRTQGLSHKWVWKSYYVSTFDGVCRIVQSMTCSSQRIYYR